MSRLKATICFLSVYNVINTVRKLFNFLHRFCFEDAAYTWIHFRVDLLSLQSTLLYCQHFLHVLVILNIVSLHLTTSTFQPFRANNYHLSTWVANRACFKFFLIVSSNLSRFFLFFQHFSLIVISLSHSASSIFSPHIFSFVVSSTAAFDYLPFLLLFGFVFPPFFNLCCFLNYKLAIFYSCFLCSYSSFLKTGNRFLTCN